MDKINEITLKGDIPSYSCGNLRLNGFNASERVIQNNYNHLYDVLISQ